jgi:Spy/CpxP family protein refolding chaperone
MNFRIVLPILAGTVLLASTALLAQAPGQPPANRPAPKLDEVKAYLSLTDAQVQQIQAIRESTRTQAHTIMTQIREKQESLRTLLDSNTTDALSVGNQMLQVRSLHQQMEQAHASARTSAQNVLTAEQKAKLAQLQSAAGLRPVIGQAAMLGLINPPADGGRGRGRRGFGPGPGFGPAGRDFPRRGPVF